MLNSGELINTFPTVGVNVETIKYNNIYLRVWDFGGQAKIPPLWHHNPANNIKGLIFVIDSSDRERTDEAKEELYKLLQEDVLSNVTLLVLANK